MELNRLTLKNFKGVKELELTPGGENMTIRGRNATGKTTVMDAFCWLLFGKDSQNKKDFEIKTLDQDGKAINGLDHEVEAELRIGDRTQTFKKKYREDWTKQRGSAEATFTGHTTDHFINGVPLPQKEYNKAIEAIAPEEVFRLLTDPRHFNNALHWTKRRELLIEVCGDVPDAEVIGSSKTLSKLPSILGDRSIEDHRKVIAAQRKEIQKELDRIPTRIDEVTLSLPERPTDERGAWENMLTLEQSLLRDKEKRLIELESGGRAAELKKRLSELTGQIMDQKNAARAGTDEAIDRLMDSKRQLSQSYSQATTNIDNLKQTIKGSEKAITREEEQLKALRAEWGTIDATEYADPDQEAKCPACGQDLPEAQVAAAREKALANFNRDKAQKLERITSEGKAGRGKIDELKAGIIDMEEELKEAEIEAANILEQAKELQEKIANLSAQETGTDDKALARLEAQKTAAEAELEKLKESTQAEIDKQRAEVDSHREKINQAVGQLHAYEQHENAETRIKELKAQERKLAEEYEKLEKELFLTEEFIKAKVKHLEDKISGHFELARFKMFEQQINGGIEPTCETLYNGVPYGSSLNNGARINVGLDIIRTLSRHYGITAPIFVDNAEAVNELIPMEAQIIKLEVSDDNQLTIDN